MFVINKTSIILDKPDYGIPASISFVPLKSLSYTILKIPLITEMAWLSSFSNYTPWNKSQIRVL